MHQIVHEMSFKSGINVLNSNPKNIHLCNVSRVSYQLLQCIYYIVEGFSHFVKNIFSVKMQH